MSIASPIRHSTHSDFVVRILCLETGYADTSTCCAWSQLISPDKKTGCSDGSLGSQSQVECPVCKM
jgi:hypothetical protein